ncbi:MAG: cytochrome b/b6 domain-containing protein [Coriobacteriia bacterium]
MKKGVLPAVGLVLAFGLGTVWAVQITRSEGGGLLFDSAWWLVFLAPLLGVLAAAFTRRQDPRIDGDRVLRHDGAARLEHWTHGLGTALLLATGIALGFLFLPRLVRDTDSVWLTMNLHFVGVVVFLFGTFYYAANTLISAYRFREHLPTGNAISFTVQHYGKLLGVKKFTMPPEDKYFESEKMAYVLAILASVGVILSGIVKVLAHIMDIPGWLAGIATPVHGVSTIAMLLFFLAHVFFSSVLPMSWPVLRSMFTGYVPREYAEKEHAGWYQRLSASETTTTTTGKEA